MSIATAMAGDKDKEAFQPGPATSYPGHQTAQKITIAAIPYTSEEQTKAAFGKVDPNKYGILPVLVVLQNDTGKALRLDLKADFVDSANHNLVSVPPGDVVLLDGSLKDGWKLPAPSRLPFPRKKKKGPLNTWQIEGRAFNAHLVPPGDSVHGFFYFETSNQPGAHLYLDGISDAASGKQYFYFEVPLTK
ncbi:MAG TPA: hypothetical protein VFW83_08410 [Bryobacteraceae bacterium]|nr:hypothetical protein [Bryobacteraceae bacterium]